MFVGLSGDWWLRTLGAAVDWETCTKHHSEKVIGQPAQARYDWYMQAAGLAVQLHKD